MRMKKFTLLTLALLMMSVVAFAQKAPEPYKFGFTPNDKEYMERRMLVQEQMPQAVRSLTGMAAKYNKAFQRSLTGMGIAKAKNNVQSRRVSSQAPSAGATETTFYLQEGEFYVYTGSWSDYTDEMPSVTVAFDTNDLTQVWVKGLSYYFPDTWVEGNFDTSAMTITLPTGQLLGSDEGDNIYFMGISSFEPLTEADVVFAIDMENMICTNEDIYVCEANAASISDASFGGFYTQWVPPMVYSATAPEPDVVVEVPTGLVTSDWLFTAQKGVFDNDGNLTGFEDYSANLTVGFDGDDVYVQGLCSYLPDAWVKGVKNGNQVVFPTGQYFGEYWGSYKMYFVGLGDDGLSDVTMTLNTEGNQLSTEDWILVNGKKSSINIYALYGDPITLTEIPDVAATPATPEITQFSNSGSYGWVVKFDIPVEDANGNPIISSKLFYKIYSDTEHEVSALTFTPTTHSELTADMTEIPYGFTEDWDFYETTVYLNDLYSSSWNKIGIQSIYYGGGERKESEIFWFVITPYSHEVTFVAANDLSIQNGNATVKVDGNAATVSAEGKLKVPETYPVTLSAAKGYKFTSVTSTGATIELDQNGFVATFEMPENDVTVNYEMRELGSEIDFATTGEYTIQDGQATVTVNGDDVTENIDETGKLLDVATDATVTITAEPGFKLTNVTASYTEKSAGGASGELTVYDGTATNGYVPVYGFYADAYNKCEFVMPASVLTGMSGSNISAMKFYTSESAVNWGDAQFQVFMKEVTDETISAFSGPGTVVYEGALSIENGEMNVEFTTPYTYNGGNLLIGFYQPVTGTYVSAYFYGETVTGASISGYSYSNPDAISPTPRNFLPKTTFTYGAAIGGGAAEVQVGSGDLIQSYLPTYNLYNYSVTQQIYTASEIGQAGSINSIAYYCTSNAVARNLDVYLVHTSKDAFDSTTDWIVVSESDKVFSGNVDFAHEAWTTITLDKPFNYNGTDNLCVIVDDNTGNWHSSMRFKVYDATNQSIVIYDDNTNYEISSISSFEGYYKAYKNQMVLGMSTAPAIDLDVNLAADGNSASFTVPEGTVTVNYELVRLGYSINVPADTYITYYTDKDITIYDEDCELLTVTAVDETTVTATPLEVAAAETPLLIYNSSDEKKELWIVPTEDTPYAALYEPDEIEVAPEFKGTLVEKTFTAAEMNAAEHFICDGENFIWVRSEGTIAANKCWLELTNDEPLTARAIVIGAAETTGISNVNANVNLNGNYYDLQGRRVMQPVKGLYISNGKKVMVK